MLETLYWVFSTIPQVLAASMAVTVAVVLPHIGNMSNLIREKAEDVYSFISKGGQEQQFTEIYAEDNVPELLRRAKLYFAETDRTKPVHATIALKRAEDLLEKRRILLLDAKAAISLAALTIGISLFLLVFSAKIAEDTTLSIGLLAFTALAALYSVGLFAALAYRVLTTF